MDALNRHRECLFVPSHLTSTHYLLVRSEGGQDCQKAQDEAQANGTITSGGLSPGNSMGSGPPDSAGSFVPMELNNGNSIGGDYRYGVKSEPDWMVSGGVLM